MIGIYLFDAKWPAQVETSAGIVILQAASIPHPILIFAQFRLSFATSISALQVRHGTMTQRRSTTIFIQTHCQPLSPRPVKGL